MVRCGEHANLSDIIPKKKETYEEDTGYTKGTDYDTGWCYGYHAATL